MQQTHRTLLCFILILEYVWCPFFGYLSQYHFFLIIHYHFPADVFRPRRSLFSFCMGSIIKHEKTFITHIGQIWTGLNGLNASVNWSCSGSILSNLIFQIAFCEITLRYADYIGLLILLCRWLWYIWTSPSSQGLAAFASTSDTQRMDDVAMSSKQACHWWFLHSIFLAWFLQFCHHFVVLFSFSGLLKWNRTTTTWQRVPVLPARPVARHSWMCDGVRSGFSSWRHASDFKVMQCHAMIQISEVKLLWLSSFERLIWRISSIRPIRPPIRWEPRGSWRVGFDPVQLWQLSRSPELLQLVKAWCFGDPRVDDMNEITWNHMSPLVSTGHDETTRYLTIFLVKNLSYQNCEVWIVCTIWSYVSRARHQELEQRLNEEIQQLFGSVLGTTQKTSSKRWKLTKFRPFFGKSLLGCEILRVRLKEQVANPKISSEVSWQWKHIMHAWMYGWIYWM